MSQFEKDSNDNAVLITDDYRGYISITISITIPTISKTNEANIEANTKYTTSGDWGLMGLPSKHNSFNFFGSLGNEVS